MKKMLLASFLFSGVFIVLSLIVKKHWILIFSFLGFCYQITTLALMFANDILSQNNIRMWGGFFPWWTIFFTFTFWSNFFLLVCYFFYTFFPKMQRNHLFLYACTCYIALVLIVVAIALLPAAIATQNSVNFNFQTPPLTYAALIMPHGPGPIIFIIYAFLIFNFQKQGNIAFLKHKAKNIFGVLLSFFIPYLLMIIALNWIPIGAYILHGQHKINLPGFSVYSFFTDLNTNLLYNTDHYGSGWHIIFFIFGLILLWFIHSVMYWTIKKKIMRNYFLIQTFYTSFLRINSRF